MKKLLVGVWIAALVFSSLAFAGLEEADSLVKEGKWQEAEAEYRKVLPELSGEEAAGVLIKIGRACSFQGKLEEALSEFQKVQEIDGVSVQALSQAQQNIGMTYYRMGREKYGNAIAALRKAQELGGLDSSDLSTSQFYIGETLWRQRKYEEAVEELRKVGEIKGAHTHALVNARLYAGYALMRQEKYDEAIEELSKIKEIKGVRDSRVKAAQEAIDKCLKAKAEQE